MGTVGRAIACTLSRCDDGKPPWQSDSLLARSAFCVKPEARCAVSENTWAWECHAGFLHSVAPRHRHRAAVEKVRKAIWPGASLLDITSPATHTSKRWIETRPDLHMLVIYHFLSASAARDSFFTREYLKLRGNKLSHSKLWLTECHFRFGHLGSTARHAATQCLRTLSE